MSKYRPMFLTMLFLSSSAGSACAGTDAGPADPGTVRATLDVTTGELVVSANGVVNWFIEHPSPVFPAPLVPKGGAPGDHFDPPPYRRVGETNLHPFSYENHNFGAVTAPGVSCQFTLAWNSALGSPLQNGTVRCVPEPGVTSLWIGGLVALSFRRRSQGR